MNNILELTLLYDFYGELLTKKQKTLFELYYLNDFSLNEIAEDAGVSRQAVSDLLIRVKKKLYIYEKKLGLVKSHSQLKQELSDIREALGKETFGKGSSNENISSMIDKVINKL